MEFLSILLIGIALAMDSFSVAITAGSNIKHIHFSQPLLIATYFGFFQWFMTISGWYGGAFFSASVKNFDHWIALLLLAGIGGKMVYESLQDEEEDEKKFTLSHKLLFVLAIATSIDALGIGLSYSFLNKPILLSAALIGVIAFLFSYCGVYLGKYLQNIFKNKMELVGGLILIGIGIKILFDHGVFS